MLFYGLVLLLFKKRLLAESRLVSLHRVLDGTPGVGLVVRGKVWIGGAGRGGSRGGGGGGGGGKGCTTHKATPLLANGREPVWPSGKAVGW